MSDEHSSEVAQVAHEFDTIRGRVLGMIESWGLPQRQEDGCKGTFKSLTYDGQAKIEAIIEKRSDDSRASS
jgi:hypothetical protein